ncbi:hypothetical protein PFISCL1PPCAC_16846, partial [Pristionchus fissidentatus]
KQMEARIAQMQADQLLRAEREAEELIASDNGKFRYNDESITFAKKDLTITTERLGRGSDTVQVFRGTFMTPKKELEVAVKVMRVIDPKGRDKGRTQTAMIQEAVVGQRAATHDNVVRLFGFVIEGPTCYMAMELMAANLDEVKMMAHDRENLDAPRLESFLGCATVAVVDALTFLRNEAHVMHRDLKPNNIMISGAGDVKLCDFGESKKLATGLSTKARTGDAGCIKYMAPERFEASSKEKGYGSKSEVWSLGITLVEVAIGKFPYEGATHYNVSLMIVNGEPPVLDRDHGSLQFRNFINACLFKQEENRDGLVGEKRLQARKFYRQHASIELETRRANVKEILELVKPHLNSMRK